MDPEYESLDGISSFPPDFMTSNQWMFKFRKGSRPDTPTIREALTGPYHDEFLKAMLLEISELEAHKTCTVVKRQDVSTTVKVIPLTLVFSKSKDDPVDLCRKLILHMYERRPLIRE